ncbi:hypothetical protein HBI56_100880 [Parastagonospora nodorum]|uniref:Uncharacterized protein n=1 Tax=Phaeosphaeria nodorum (strain SN15 / ATCC MYA-4574 / FGSC 10173) TaxID=321614 RepID=A0A7U2F7S3_PHANO|nr:hypothetical protein HBH56_029800 [Parastagonospora nodorum]QRC99228.1 hypothetical protein JI435_413140 [Parastagonospora nodorum SN15]KAH3934128.1 hypothetical protein HBH54_052210 [Parastagonospora nodorum]KAH3943116.1 hypothetical protein HBH53_178490 [Parastagonospora nodorum]KAH3959299.1 hypothetical protein HBH51_200850 [Parastagonospora nodorum]
MNHTPDSKGVLSCFTRWTLYYILFFSLFHITVISTCICITRWALCLLRLSFIGRRLFF